MTTDSMHGRNSAWCQKVLATRAAVDTYIVFGFFVKIVISRFESPPLIYARSGMDERTLADASTADSSQSCRRNAVPHLLFSLCLLGALTSSGMAIREFVGWNAGLHRPLMRVVSRSNQPSEEAETVKQVVVLQNVSSRKIEIVRDQSTCSCVGTRLSRSQVNPGERVDLTAILKRADEASQRQSVSIIFAVDTGQLDQLNILLGDGDHPAT